MAYIEKLPIEVTNPDGKVIELFTSGDEFSNYIHDEWGNKIMQGDDGYYYYAYQYKEEIFPGRLRVDKNKYPFKVWKKEIADTDQQYKRRAERMYNIPKEDLKKRSNLSYFSEYTDSDDNDTLLQSAPELENSSNSMHLGTLNNITIFIRFSDDDENWYYDLDHYQILFNSTTGDSIRNYYKEISYNKVDVVSDLYPKGSTTTILSFKDIHPRNYYQPYSSTNTIGYQSFQRADREHELLERAIKSIESQVPQDAVLDNNGDGRVDSVSFICKGRASGWGSILWGHRWVLYGKFVYIHGKRVYDYTFQPENQATRQVIAHELFHVFGAPDLYRYSDRSITPVGPWDLMGYGSGHMGAWMKWKYTKNKWIETIPVIDKPGTYSINSLQSPTNNVWRINSSQSSSEFFLVELRSKEYPNTYDNTLPRTGLIIYRINSSINTGNRNGPPDEVYIFRENGTPTVSGSINNAAYNELYNQTEISDTTNPKLHFSDGSICNDIKITDIKIDTQNNQATFSYNIDEVGKTYKLSLEKNPSDIGFVEGDGEYAAGTIVSIKATV